MTLHRRAFDSEALYVALDQKRRAEHLSWRAVSAQAGVTAVNLGTYLGRGRSVSADSLVLLMRWLGETDITAYASTAATTRDHEGATTR